MTSPLSNLPPTDNNPRRIYPSHSHLVIKYSPQTHQTVKISHEQDFPKNSQHTHDLYKNNSTLSKETSQHTSRHSSNHPHLSPHSNHSPPSAQPGLGSLTQNGQNLSKRRASISDVTPRPSHTHQRPKPLTTAQDYKSL